MTVLIPIAVSLLTTAGFLFLLWKIKELPRGAALIAFGAPALIAVLFALAVTLLGRRQGTATAVFASFLFTLGGCAFVAFRRSSDKLRRMFRRLGLVTMIAVTLEMTVFNYSAYAAPQEGAMTLDPDEASADTLIESDGGRSLAYDLETSVQWELPACDTKNVAVTLRSPVAKAVEIAVSARDRNFSTVFIALNRDSYVIDGETTVLIPVSSQGTQEIRLSFSPARNVQLIDVTINAPRTIDMNPLRIGLMLIVLWAAVLIVSFGLHRVVYRSDSSAQLLITCLAAVLCVALLAGIAAAHVNPNNPEGGLLLSYDADAVGKDPYYQLFDAFHKGQSNLDVPVDERLAAAGDLAYDYGYRYQENIPFEWDRAYYNGKYYSYFGTAPLYLFYYPVYALTGQVPSTQLTCLFLSALFVIFGFMLVFRIARTVVKEANYLLTLLCAAALPLTAGVYILTAYGDFYNLPKLCALAFLLLLGYLTIAGYEQPRWWVFLLCGLCVGAILASRPNVLIVALGLAPLYLGVLFRRGLAVGRKLLCLVSFLVPIGVVGALVMAYNQARFGAPLEFGAKYQLTVNNIAMNNVSLGMLGTSFHYYFLELPNASPVFPYLIPRYNPTDTYTRYVYLTPAFGVMSLPLNWSLAAYPAVRRSEGLKPAYRWTLVTVTAMTVLTAWLDFAMAGLTISYVCDIAAAVSLVAITILLLAEKKARSSPGVHKGVYIGAMILLCASFAVGVLLLLGTEPLFVKTHIASAYGNIQNLFRF